MKKDYGELEKRIGYEFKDIRLLITALTHTSFANELKVNKTESYERLEFLGDAILEYIVSDYLFRKKREYEEGKLTKLRASLVCEFTLSQISESLGYGKFVLLARVKPRQAEGQGNPFCVISLNPFSVRCILMAEWMSPRSLSISSCWMTLRQNHCSTMQSQPFRNSARRMEKN